MHYFYTANEKKVKGIENVSSCSMSAVSVTVKWLILFCGAWLSFVLPNLTATVSKLLLDVVCRVVGDGLLL